MKWILKAAVQKVISLLPFSEELNYFFQANITRSIPVSEKEIVEGRGTRAAEHLDIIRKHSGLDINTILFYEFGAGWDLVIPLTFYAGGVNRQVITDIKPHIRFNLVNDSKRKINNCSEAIFKGKQSCRKLDETNASSIGGLKEHFGIEYVAPSDARQTTFKDNSIDCCTNTYTLEHIPEEDIRKIFKETYRILKPGAVLCCFIDMQDHYSYFDNSVSVYNYLKFNKTRWRLINSDVHYQNRLRYPDYKTIFKDCGFEIVYEDLHHPDEEDMRILYQIKIHKDFSHYTLTELGIRSCKTLLRKPYE